MNNASKGHCVTVTPQGNRTLFLLPERFRGNEKPLGLEKGIQITSS